MKIPICPRTLGIGMVMALTMACNGNGDGTGGTDADTLPDADGDTAAETDIDCSFDDTFLSELYSGRSVPPSPSCEATYYVDATSGDDAASGVSETAAWKTLGKVNASSLPPGACVFLKAGEQWKEQLDVPTLGEAGRVITFSSYGSGAKPIITATGDVPGWNTSSNWTDEGGGVWSLTVDDDPGRSPKRVWLSGTEYMRSEDIAGIGPTHRWFYENGTAKLYVHAPQNPANEYSSVRQGGVFDTAVNVAGKDYITLQNLDIRGGRTASVGIYGSDYVIVEGCDIGAGSDVHGIDIGDKYWEPTDPDSVNGLIRWNLIDSGNRLAYPFDKVYPEDGVALSDGTNGWEVYGNEVRDWGHTGVNLAHSTPGMTVANNKVYENLFTAPDVSYFRAFATSGLNGGCQYNEITHNIVRDTTVRSQVGGNNNVVKFNVFDTVRNSVFKSWGTAQAIMITHANYVGDWVAYGNVVANNIIYDTDEPGIVLVAYDDTFEMPDNQITDNIVLNSGTNSKDGYSGVAVMVQDRPLIARNTFSENILYSAAGATVVSYRGTTYTVEGFQEQDGTSGDIISGNAYVDPLLNDPENGDYRMADSSPCGP